MTSRLTRLAALTLAIAAFGCVKPGAKVPTMAPATEGTIGTSKVTMETGSLLGTAIAPVIAAGGANVISAGGGNVISAGGGNVISAGGGNVISAGGGNVISAGGGNYHVFDTAVAAEAELPVMGAVVVLRDPVTRKRIPWIKPVVTDDKGAFSFDKLPAKVNYLVEVVFMTKDQKPFRMLSLARPGKTGATAAKAQVSWRSMAVVTSMLDSAKEAKGLYVADPAKLAAAEQKLEKAILALTAEKRAERMRMAIEVPVETLSKTATNAPALVVGDELSMTAVAPTKAMMAETVETAPELKTEMTTVTTVAVAEPTTEQLTLVSAASTVMTTATAPTITSDAVVVQTTIAAKPALTTTIASQVALASPVPSPSPTLAPITVATTAVTTIALNPTIVAQLASPSPSPSPTLAPITTITQPVTTIINPVLLVSPSPSPTATPIIKASIKPISRFP